MKILSDTKAKTTYWSFSSENMAVKVVKRFSVKGESYVRRSGEIGLPSDTQNNYHKIIMSVFVVFLLPTHTRR